MSGILKADKEDKKNPRALMLSEISQSGSLCRFVVSYKPVNATIFWVEVEISQHEQPALWKQWMVLMARCGVETHR